MVADRQTPTWRLLGVEFRGKAAEALGSTLRACLITSWDPRTPRPPWLWGREATWSASLSDTFQPKVIAPGLLRYA